MSDVAYNKMFPAWKAGGAPRPHSRPDGFSTRYDINFMSPAELAITNAMAEVEKAGASASLTAAVVRLGQARDMVADHVESAKSV